MGPRGGAITKELVHVTIAIQQPTPQLSSKQHPPYCVHGLRTWIGHIETS